MTKTSSTKTAISFVACTLALTVWTAPRTADAFCGFYVGGAGSDLYNNATQVVLMREGTRTVLSMQNNYQGPTKNFAMVVPVPVVLKKENVKILERALFKRVDKLAAPRLVEYWERDPCMILRQDFDDEGNVPQKTAMAVTKKAAKKLGVKIEAKFAVGEYKVLILSAKDSTGLETWLTQEKYTIPKGAAKYLKPYVASGSKFFVAKVDASKVTFKNNQAMLSPLRVHYDSKEFALPIRLGMMNSKGKQDLIVHVLARGQRYQVSNYKNVTIPTNLQVVDGVRKRFGEFYASLFDTTLEKNPGAVVTEYSWNASTCDPCPEPALRPNELASLGADVLTAVPGNMRNFVLTRLHARYGKGSIKDDLIFKQVGPIVGGREHLVSKGKIEYGSRQGSRNNFQGRYIIRHKWQGPIKCAKPVRNVWGGPPSSVKRSSAPVAAMDLAFAPRGQVILAKLVKQNIPELSIKSAAPTSAAPRPTAKGKPYKRVNSKNLPTKHSNERRSDMKCSCASTSPQGTAGTLLLGLAVALVIGRRRSNAR